MVTDRDFHVWNTTGCDIRIRDASSAELRLTVDNQAVLTQGAVYVPVDAVDDNDAAWSFSWERITLPEIWDLEHAVASGRTTLSDPIGLNCSGYLTNLQYQGIPGMVDSDTGLELYSASCEYRVVHLAWQPFIPVLTEYEYDEDATAGISHTGRYPLTFRGNSIDSEDGWLLLWGGDVDPWNSVVPPLGEVWTRVPRVFFPPGHGVDARWLEIHGEAVAPARGSVFMAFKPLPPPEEEDGGGDDGPGGLT